MEEVKARGNAAFAGQQWQSAAGLYTECLALDPLNPVVYANRAAAYLQVRATGDSKRGGEGFQQRLWRSSSSASPPHRPREDGLTHPADTLHDPILRRPWLCFRAGGFPIPNGRLAHAHRADGVLTLSRGCWVGGGNIG